MPETIDKILDSTNIALELDDDELAQIGADAHLGYEIDEDSRSDWLVSQEEAIELAAQLLHEKAKPGEANVKYPLISISSMQFSARAYGSIIPGGPYVNGRGMGR